MRWMVSEPVLQQGKEIWQRCRKLSADDISAYSNLYRLAEQREAFRIRIGRHWRIIMNEVSFIS